MTQQDRLFYRDFSQTDLPTIVRGEGVYLYDDHGKRYLDARSGSNLINIGHGNEEVAEAMANQAKTIAYIHSSIFRAEAPTILANKVAEWAPGNLDKVWFVCGGSEANESALKFARQYWVGKGQGSRHRFVARWNSYHGSTITTQSLGGQTAWRKVFSPLLSDDFSHIPAPYCYRCPLGLNYPDCGVACADTLAAEIKLRGPDNVAAFFAEPVIGSALAAVVAPPEYFPRIREICDEFNVLFVADEIMSGFGRTGTNFAIDHWGVVPDILVFGKGISGGYMPLAGMIIKEGLIDVILEQYDGKFHHGFTYVGSPLTAAVGVAVMTILERENLVERSREMGEYLMERLETLYAHPTVGEVRGKGLMTGIEFVADRETKRPFPPEVGFAGLVAGKAMARGVSLFATGGFIDGVAGDQILLTPPLIVTHDQIDEIISVIDVCLTELETELL